MVNETIGHTRIAAAGARFQVEPEEHVVATFLAERTKLHARNFGEIGRDEFDGNFRAGSILRAERRRLEVRPGWL